MNLDKLAVVLRPRSNWEAIDLGVRMVQSWARSIYLAWLSIYLPLAVLLALLAYALDLHGWAPVLIWWLKPLFDRVVLYLLSHAVFGELHDWRAAWRTLPALLGRTGLLRSLTWTRFSAMRSFTQPVTQLEGLRGKPARDRRQLLARQSGGAAWWLTFAMLHFELIFVLALVGLVFMMLPEEVAENTNFWTFLFRGQDPQHLADLIFTVIYTAIVAFLEPFYVASGFALYLRRRTDLEAWDVELALRRLQPSAAPSPRASAAAAALLLIATLVTALTIPPARADDVDRAAAVDPATRAPEAIAEVMKRPEFGAERSFWRLKYVGPEEEERDASWLQRLLTRITKALKLIGKFIAQISRVAMWVALVILLTAVAWMSYRYWRLHGGRSSRAVTAPPAEVAGFDIRPESLPQDVAAAAMALVQAGQARAALSLLYRAALSALAHRDRVEFNRGDAEGDCLRRVRLAAAHCAGFFEQLTGAWQEVAYASHRIPLQRLEELCHRWPQHFALPR